jgi:hypothetical protein
VSNPGRAKHYADFYGTERRPGSASSSTRRDSAWQLPITTTRGRSPGAAYALVMQPVRDDYRGLPSGTRQLEALLPSSSLRLRIPVAGRSAAGRRA